MNKIFVGVLLLFALSFGSEQSYKILSVSDYNFTMGGKPSVSIFVGKSDTEWFDITIHRDQIVEYNMIMREPQTKEKIIDASGTKEGVQYGYLIRGSYPTIFFNIMELNEKDKIAKVMIGADLFNTEINKYMRLKSTIFIFKGENYEKLTKLPRKDK